MQTTRALAAAALIAVLAGCGTPTVTSTADGTAAAKASSAPKKAGAGVGDAITLKGTDEALKIAVKLVKVIPTAKGKDQFNKPSAGKRFYAVELVLKNVGKIAYDDSPFNSAKVIDSKGQQHDPTLSEVSGGAALTTTKIGTGDSRRGILAFEVPKAAKIVKLQFALDSGMAQQTGEWSTR